MKLLFATDGSDFSKAALEEIANRPYPSESSIHIISIIDNVAFTPGSSPMGAMNEFYAESARTALSKAKENIEMAEKVLRMKNPALTVTTAILTGSPKSTILDEAEKLQLTQSHLYHTLLGELYKSKDIQKAASCFLKALRLAKTPEDRQLIQSKIDKLGLH